MKLDEVIILERGSALLYHWMDVNKAKSMFNSDSLNQVWTHETKEGVLKGISFSRNRSFTFGDKAVRLTIDQSKIANNFKIQPLDAERSFHYSIRSSRWYDIKDRKLNSPMQQYAEEFVITNTGIKDVHKYITKIEINSSYSDKIFDAAKEYSDKWNIALSEFK